MILKKSLRPRHGFFHTFPRSRFPIIPAHTQHDRISPKIPLIAPRRQRPAVSYLVVLGPLPKNKVPSKDGFAPETQSLGDTDRSRIHGARLPHHATETHAAVLDAAQSALEHQAHGIGRDVGAVKRRQNHDAANLGREMGGRCSDERDDARESALVVLGRGRPGLVDDSQYDAIRDLLWPVHEELRDKVGFGREWPQRHVRIQFRVGGGMGDEGLGVATRLGNSSADSLWRCVIQHLSVGS